MKRHMRNRTSWNGGDGKRTDVNSGLSSAVRSILPQHDRDTLTNYDFYTLDQGSEAHRAFTSRAKAEALLKKAQMLS